MISVAVYSSLFFFLPRKSVLKVSMKIVVLTECNLLLSNCFPIRYELIILFQNVNVVEILYNISLFVLKFELRF